MSSDRSPLSVVAQEVPLDLVAVIAIVFVGWLTVAVGIPTENPVVVPIALLFVIVAPGYAIVCALFPARRAAETSEGHRLDVRGLDFPERLALGVGTSIVVAPFVAFSLQATIAGIARTPVVVMLGMLTVSAAVIAALRWRALPAALRYRIGVAPGNLKGTADRALVIVVAIAVVMAISSVAYATTTASGGEDLTEFYILAIQDDGTLLADRYPSVVEMGEPVELYVGLDNHRGEETTYTVVSVIQVVDLNTGEVVRQEELQRYTTTVEDEGTWGVRDEFSPNWDGLNIRVMYLLYVESPPSVVSADTAAQSVHLWLEVVDPLEEKADNRDQGAAETGSDGVADGTATVQDGTTVNGTTNTTASETTNTTVNGTTNTTTNGTTNTTTNGTTNTTASGTTNTTANGTTNTTANGTSTS